MDPSRKRRVRLVTALTIALLLAGALVYTTFSAASPERIPSQLSTAQSGQSYKLGGKVVAGSVKRTPDSMTFLNSGAWRGSYSVIARWKP